MNPEVDRLIREAISGHRLIRFRLDGFVRVAEPHDYGSLKEIDRVLVYQVGGGSHSGRLPDWRLVTVEKMSGLEVLEQTFVGPRETPTRRRHHWDQLYASVYQER